MNQISPATDICSGIFWYLGAKEPGYLQLLETGAQLTASGRSISTCQMVLAEQVHGATVHVCSASDSGAGFASKAKIAGADALISNIRGQYLIIRTADCLPILLYDTAKMVVAAIHSGREGTRQNIVGKTILRMAQDFGCQPKEIFAQVGAGICERHYQVSQPLYDEFNASLSAQGFSPAVNQNRQLNLRTAVFRQLIRAGLPFYNIDNHQICTYENPGYYSHRRDATDNRQINIIGVQ